MLVNFDNDASSVSITYKSAYTALFAFNFCAIATTASAGPQPGCTLITESYCLCYLRISRTWNKIFDYVVDGKEHTTQPAKIHMRT